MAVWEARLPGVLAVGEAAGKGRQSAAGRGPSPMRGAGSGSGAVSERGRGQGSVDCCWGGARGGGGAPRIREPRLRVQASGWGRDDGGCSGSGRAPLRGLRAFHPLHVFYRPLGPPAHADHPECEQYPVPALSHHGCQRTVLLQTAALLGLLLLGYTYFQLLVPDWTSRLRQLGLFCSIFTISMYLSPLADLAKIIQTKSTQCLSFSLTVATLLASASWTLYGLHLRDLYIMVPNIPGILTSLVRLGLFWQYPQVQEKNYSLLQT
ncbi:sugar transporter SWEET1 isoform X1 [Antechinus flavipes]|uniref:sugar transporter SWEET1 isoform X1 n=1 Tax=Antechinus flavipes TaxID=38775 RepID=UPI0022368FBD|nr:sugar transporter SWEET1 isoform X1 [Antechinus flavipes]